MESQTLAVPSRTRFPVPINCTKSTIDLIRLCEKLGAPWMYKRSWTWVLGEDRKWTMGNGPGSGIPLGSLPCHGRETRSRTLGRRRHMLAILFCPARIRLGRRWGRQPRSSCAEASHSGFCEVKQHPAAEPMPPAGRHWALPSQRYQARVQRRTIQVDV